MRLALALAAAALVAAPATGAQATSCSAAIGPYSCPVQASASVWGDVWFCEEMIGATGWYCVLNWYESFSGSAITPGTVTISEFGYPISGGCQWLTATGCSGTRTQNQTIVITTCGSGWLSTDFEFEATATSALGTVTDYATSTLWFPNPYAC